jgi:NMD protein affecting ribosome stability and mRNA decay
LQELDIAVAAGTTCVTCGTDTTSKWVNYKDKPGIKICVSCYQKHMLDVAAAAGTTCVKCGTDATSGQWYSWKAVPGTKICKLCYQKDLRHRKKAANAKAE